MQRVMLKSKIHRARVSDCALHYVGSLTIAPDLLEAAGVDTVPELAQRKPENLAAKMVEVNEAKKLVRRVPTEEQVAAWVADRAADRAAGPSTLRQRC